MNRGLPSLDPIELPLILGALHAAYDAADRDGEGYL